MKCRVLSFGKRRDSPLCMWYMKMNSRVWILNVSLAVLLSSCYEERDVPVVIDFQYSVVENSYTVPVVLMLSNNTSGADFYSWTFEGASPATSDKKQPGPITYSQAGTYIIKLEAWNDFQRSEKEIVVTLDSAVAIGFDAAVLVNDFVPATVELTNYTDGASSYAWTFEGGTPGTSDLANPGAVQFTEPGDHVITLRVSNGREFFTTSHTITLRESLLTDFQIEPSFEDEDYEAPLTASLTNNTRSGLRYTWSSTGGDINNTTADNTIIHFANPGDYTVTLKADNDKETETIERTIHVKPNTNLYTMTDIKLGVSAAHASIGSFYSTKLRRVLTKDEVSADNGGLIDVVFYGVNSTFNYCRFMSPAEANQFPSIPHAQQVKVVNTLESGPLSFTPEQFDAMTNDAPLQALNIAAHDTGTASFSSSETPRIVLFETADGRKGAIKIKSFVPDGTQSYIIADVKVQKLQP
jgi:PKD repeat protein